MQYSMTFKKFLSCSYKTFGGFVQDKAPARKKNIKFHINSDDYFITLATIIGILEDDNKKIKTRHRKILKKLKDELIFLQKNYMITKRKGKKSRC